ncbi:ABC-type sugar transport system, periplasmic component [Thermobacillus composti KWC4]|jgi:multiple sugar transport system substrate-binding protein|uniref:ABC-type sugar transport system, periplasmic component n=1 Tax=Thermobacillus composti (strain DSM 18247 / JCM 13945 / KWC4) TaxID=717605 RepID=L0EI91_THECK|nr:extracellular solute-binding protein [Thermobacillus composti]AGA59339.1 ABC-type sugar transport system, periplasmic component [Thermobacillus composti KWC4]
MEKHPGVKIEFIDVDYERNFKQLLEDPSQMPDVIELTVNEARLPMKGRIVNLADRIEDMADKWQGDYMTLIEFAELEGEAYLLPIRSEPMMVFYITDIFENKGITPPWDGWTWDDYLSIGQQLVREGHAVWNPPSLNEVEPFIVGFGGRYTDAKHRIAGVMDSPETVNAFVRYAEILNAVSSAEQFTSESAFMNRGLIVGRALRIREEYERVSIAPIPEAPDGRRYNNSLMTGLAITTTAQQPELAWAYIKFMLGESSDEAIDAVVNYTVGASGADSSFQPIVRKPETLEELKQWLRYEITISPPASFDFAWMDRGSRASSAPGRPIPQYYAYTDVNTAQADLTQWAQEIEAYAATFAGQTASGR